MARRLGASGTPAFLINGRLLIGAHPFETFKQILHALDNELSAGAAAIAGLAIWQLGFPRGGAVGAVSTDAIGDKVQTLPRGQLPEFAVGSDVGRLYRYAVERGDELQYMPCFCGCVRFGHKNNRDCYIKGGHDHVLEPRCDLNGVSRRHA